MTFCETEEDHEISGAPLSGPKFRIRSRGVLWAYCIDFDIDLLQIQSLLLH